MTPDDYNIYDVRPHGVRRVMAASCRFCGRPTDTLYTSGPTHHRCMDRKNRNLVHQFARLDGRRAVLRYWVRRLTHTPGPYWGHVVAATLDAAEVDRPQEH
jgi:hypothetical protein